MEKPAGLRSKLRKRGNPNWGRPDVQPKIPKGPSEFEKVMKELGLTTRTCAGSVELRQWCKQNRNRCYIPEWLLKEWEIDVDTE